MEFINDLYYAFAGFDFARPFSTFTALSVPLRFGYLGTLSLLVSITILPLSWRLFCVWAISFSVLVIHLTSRWSTVFISRIITILEGRRKRTSSISKQQLPHESSFKFAQPVVGAIGTAPFTPPMSPSTVVCQYWLIIYVLACLLWSLAPSPLIYEFVKTSENSFHIYLQTPINCLASNLVLALSKQPASTLPYISSLSAEYHAYKLQNIPHMQPFQLEMKCWPLPWPMRSDHLLLTQESELKSLHLSAKTNLNLISLAHFIFDLTTRYIALCTVLFGPWALSRLLQLWTTALKRIRNHNVSWRQEAVLHYHQTSLPTDNSLWNVGGILQQQKPSTKNRAKPAPLLDLSKATPDRYNHVTQTVSRKMDDPRDFDNADDIMTPNSSTSLSDSVKTPSQYIKIANLSTNTTVKRTKAKLYVSCSSSRSVGSQSTFCETDSDHADINSAGLLSSSGEEFSPHKPFFCPSTTNHSAAPQFLFESCDSNLRHRFQNAVISPSANAFEDCEYTPNSTTPSSRISFINNWVTTPPVNLEEAGA